METKINRDALLRLKGLWDGLPTVASRRDSRASTFTCSVEEPSKRALMDVWIPSIDPSELILTISRQLR